MTKSKNTPPQKELQHFFSYNPETGYFYRKADGYIGNVDAYGYRRLTYYGEIYKIHRLIWKYMTGEEAALVDHKDRNRLNNKWDNLRSVDYSANSLNSKIFSSNKSGITGVCFFKERDKWISYISVNKRQKILGYFNCPTAALVVRLRHIKQSRNLNYEPQH